MNELIIFFLFFLEMDEENEGSMGRRWKLLVLAQN
jgi:hypothetical protein